MNTAAATRPGSRPATAGRPAPPALRAAVAALAGASAGAVLGAGLAPGDGHAPDLPWCLAAAVGAALAVLAAALHRRAGRHRPAWVPAAGLLLVGGALPAAATSDSPWCAALAASAALLTAAVTAPRAAVAAGALAALAAGAVAAASAPAATAAVLGTLAGTGGLLLVADLSRPVQRPGSTAQFAHSSTPATTPHRDQPHHE
ncbi:hypothetical protein ACFV4G_22910 [Kitasatospora sp. NPDC059747]|uniref:hypothetical protein n=1 Tax=Kitasatospora sp. NPDC059747 TaxID=3346930 RepID=UPI0036677294